MQRAMEETERRRSIQQAFNLEHGVVPQTIQRSREEIIQTTSVLESVKGILAVAVAEEAPEYTARASQGAADAGEDRIEQLEEEMRVAAGRLDFERAAELRDEVGKLRRRQFG